MKKIKESSIFEGSLFKNSIEDAKAFLKIWTKLKGELTSFGEVMKKEVSKANEETSEGIDNITASNDDLTKSVDSLNKATEQEIKLAKTLNNLEKEELKLKKKLADGATEQAKSNEIIKVQIQEQNKQRKEQAKDTAGLISLYQKESKRLRTLKNSYKDLVLEGKELEQGTIDMQKEIITLDKRLRDLDSSVNDSYREIGKYKEALEETKEAMENLNKAAKATGIFAVIALLVSFAGDFFGKSREASTESAKAIAELSERVKVFVSSAIDAFGGLKDIILGYWDLIGIRFNQIINPIKIGLKEVQLAIAKGLDAIGQGTDGKVAALENEISDLANATYDLDAANEQVANGYKKLDDAFDGDVKAGNDAVAIKIKLIQATQDLEIANLRLQRSLVKLTGDQERFATISEDDTRGFEERTKASLDWLDANQKAAKIRSQIAANELKIQRINVASELVIAGIITAEQERTLTSKELNKILLNRKAVLKVSSESEQAYTDAYVNYVETQNEATINGLDTDEKIRKLKSDLIEKDLDILIDGADNQKTINERIINDDTISNEKREQLLRDTALILETSYAKQKKAIIDFGVFQTNSNRELSEDEKKAQLEKIKNADIDDLVRTQDAEILNEKIRALGLSEIFEGRLLEVIRERRTATLDLNEAQKELNTNQRESNEIVDDIIAQEETLERLRNAKTTEEFEDAQSDLEKQRQKNRIAAIDAELATVESTSRRAIELNQEKNDILLDQERTALDERTKLAEEQAAELEAIYSNVFSFLRNVSDEYFDKELERIDETLEASQKQEDKLIESAEKGVKFANESIAFERKKQAELEAERIKVEERRARSELFIASLESLQSNDGNLGKTVTDMVALREFVKAFPLFYDGTENTGAGGNLDEKGGFGAILHPYERVMSAEDNAKTGGMSNYELASLAEMYHSGVPMNVSKNESDYSNQMNELIAATQNIPKLMPRNELNYDPIQKALIQTIKVGGKTTNRIHRTNPLL